MKFFYKSFALGVVVFSGFAFAAEEDTINISEKPISEVEFIDTSFVGEEVFVKDEYYEDLEDNISDDTEIKFKDDINEGTIYTLGEIKPTVIDDEFVNIKPSDEMVSHENMPSEEVYFTTLNMTTDIVSKPEMTTTPLVTEPTLDNIEAIKQAVIGDTTSIKAEIEKDFTTQIGNEDRTLLTDAIAKHLLNNTMDATVHATKVIADGGWAEHLRKKGLLPVALEDTFGKNIIPTPVATSVALNLSSPTVAHNSTGMNHNMSGTGNICVSEPFAIMALLSACVAFMSIRRRKEV